MQFQRATLANCEQAAGVVVAIDVLRAFTTAAYAFGAGASDILLTAGVDEALALRQRFPGSLAMGEVNGLPVAGFDFGNSPVQFGADGLAGRRLVQRTSAGTQGVVRSRRAEHLLAASFACAGATARYIRWLAPQQVTFVITGAMPDESFVKTPIRFGDEDAACADYLQAVLSGLDPDPEPYLQRVWAAPAAEKFLYPDQPDFLAEDLEACTALDRFTFAMPVWRQADLLIVESVQV